ncbi:hypothetical protein BDB01DRAFT_800374 [Pilobolus umbonatus]|nr:hypothetical protein BDB01DRAFT_800374 [Pilobolus umbonatus]
MSNSRDYHNQEYQQFNGGYQSYDQESGLNDHGFSGRQDRFDSRYNTKPAPSNGMHTIEDTIYISNLPQDVTEEKLAEHFGSIGIIKTDKKLKKPKIWIYVDKTTNIPKGDATLTYDDPPSADAAIQWFGGKEFMGNIIQVTKAERKMNIPVERGSGGFERRGGGGGGRGGFRDNNRDSGRDSGRDNGRSDNPRNNNGGGAREGDWTCDDCGANNFSRRDECFKCHSQRPGGGSGSANNSRRGGGERGNSFRGSDRSEGRRDRYDDRSSRSENRGGRDNRGNRDDYGSGRHGGGGRDDYRKDARQDRRDRPY